MWLSSVACDTAPAPPEQCEHLLDAAPPILARCVNLFDTASLLFIMRETVLRMVTIRMLLSLGLLHAYGSSSCALFHHRQWQPPCHSCPVVLVPSFVLQSIRWSFTEINQTPRRPIYSTFRAHDAPNVSPGSSAQALCQIAGRRSSRWKLV
ncbi:uncharacterized protein UBRO_20926 [Ustilago bromivora]|uniref:Uncharacterized protein n=1 Tax=Ustilago bromivora TaxID=307758 RepID=A0A1K0HKN8_9BASI|nr:uncharacterized protein UBRO_20926 [Ustilago bromivora]